MLRYMVCAAMLAVGGPAAAQVVTNVVTYTADLGLAGQTSTTPLTRYYQGVDGYELAVASDLNGGTVQTAAFSDGSVAFLRYSAAAVLEDDLTLSTDSPIDVRATIHGIGGLQSSNTSSGAADSLTITPSNGAQPLYTGSWQVGGGPGPLQRMFGFYYSWDMQPGVTYAVVMTSNLATGDGYVSAFLDPAVGLSVPEPASWTFMIGGLACVGALARRRGRALA